MRFVWNLLLRLGVPERDLPDKVHDVFVVVYQRRADYDPSRPVRPWLAGIAVRVAAGYRRRSSHRQEVVQAEVEASAGGPDPEAAAEGAEARRLALEVLSGMDEDQRAVFVLHEIEGLSMPEIAQIVAAPLNTLYSRLRLGREAFSAEVRRRVGRGGT